jgi:hypothetical protein
MPSRRRDPRRLVRLDVQRLEPRLPLAGDVVATLAGGVLTLQGDVEANGVEIRMTEAGDVLVAGSRVAGAETSLIVEGEAVAQQAFGDVTVLRVRLGAGADTCGLSGRESFDLDVVDIGMGPGADRCSLGVGVTLAGTATISTGSEDDFVSISATILGDLRLLTGDGADEMAAEGIAVGGVTTLDLGGGDDMLSVVNQATFQQAVRIVTRGGDDDVALLGGIDAAASLSIVTGSGADTVFIEDVAVRGDIVIATGIGNDRVGVSAGPVARARTTVGGALRVDCGLGDDSVELLETIEVTGRLALLLGGGNDTGFTEGLVRVLGSASVNLGGGVGETFSVRQSDDSPDGRTLDVDGDVTIVQPSGTATITMSGAGPNGRPLVGRDLVIMASGGTAVIGIDGVSVGRDLRVVTGAGNDRVTVSQLSIGRRLAVATRGGTAETSIEQVAVGEDVRVSGGAGTDAVRIRNGSVQRRLFARLGAGGDSLEVNRVTVGSTDLRGGPGSDALVTDLLLNLVAPTYTGFESVERA